MLYTPELMEVIEDNLKLIFSYTDVFYTAFGRMDSVNLTNEEQVVLGHLKISVCFVELFIKGILSGIEKFIKQQLKKRDECINNDHGKKFTHSKARRNVAK